MSEELTWETLAKYLTLQEQTLQLLLKIASNSLDICVHCDNGGWQEGRCRDDVDDCPDCGNCRCAECRDGSHWHWNGKEIGDG